MNKTRVNPFWEVFLLFLDIAALAGCLYLVLRAPTFEGFVFRSVLLFLVFRVANYHRVGR